MLMALEWVRDYEYGLEFTENLGGVSWFDAPKPRWFHRHKPQSRAFLNMVLVERCACGRARTSLTRFSGSRFSPWGKDLGGRH